VLFETLCGHWMSCRQSSFASFNVSGVQRSYQDALHALHVELLATRRKAAAAMMAAAKANQPRQQHLDSTALDLMTPVAAAAVAAGTSGRGGSSSTCVVSVGEAALELQLVQLLLGLLHVELVAGHTEQAVAKIQVGQAAALQQ